MKTDLFQRLGHWPSTLIALVIILAGFVLVYLKVASFLEVSGGIPVILYALWHKGKKKEDDHQ
ncbi:MAG: hypothetical protein LPK79_07505 [Bacteroidota bacterium]|nr:hypothetical protein [Bacteroidota bacterium]